MNEPAASRHPRVGWLLAAAGVLGLASGVVPFTINALRLVLGKSPIHLPDTYAHGLEAMDLSLEWAVLSSAMGTCLGVLLLWAAVGWLKGRTWAATVSWAYVLAGVAVCGPDVLIFAFRAQPGPTRTHMLAADSVALFIPLALALWLVLTRKSRSYC